MTLVIIIAQIHHTKVKQSRRNQLNNGFHKPPRILFDVKKGWPLYVVNQGADVEEKLIG